MRRAFRALAWASGIIVLAVLICTAAGHAQQQQQPQQQPAQQSADQPVFRAGINFVRVDVIVSDKSGTSVSDLKQSDFEVTEDGRPQSVETFKFIKLDGGTLPSPEGAPRAIRTDSDEEQEAAKDDVRLFAIFLDDYHVRKENSLRVRQPLEQWVQTQLGPSDMIGLMYPLESVFNVRMTRSHEAVVKGLDRFLGRKYDYTPVNELEQQYQYLPAETQEQIRVRVALSAIRGLIVHMGTLKEGRKSLVVVSEGYSNLLPPGMTPTGAMPTGQNQGIVDPVGLAGLGGAQAQFAATIDMEQLLRDVYDEANKNNVAIYTVDPRGLAVSEFDVSDGSVNPGVDRQFLNSTMDTLRTLAVETDGRAIVNRNDLVGGMKQIVRDVSAYYLIGYSSTIAPSDGKFHEIKVKVKRPGVQVRARKGYWALTREEVARSLAPPKPGLPPAVKSALANVDNTSVASKSRSIRTWIGTTRGENGKTKVTFVWDPMPRPPGDRLTSSDQPARVSVMAVATDGSPIFRGRTPDAVVASTSPKLPGSAAGADGGPRAPSRVEFEAKPGPMQLRLSVEGAGSGVIDSEVREIVVPDLTTTQTTLGTPALYRARTPRELQQLKTDPQSVPATMREFSRMDKIFVRVVAYGAGSPAVSAHLLNRGGQTMSELIVAPPVAPATESTVDVPIASLAPGEYIVELKATGEAGEAKELVGFRVTS
jgi:VWFA-related protein